MGKPGMLQSLGSQRVGHDLAIEQQSWQQSYVSGNSFNAYTMDKIIGIHLTSLRFFFACKITTINYTCPTKHI